MKTLQLPLALLCLFITLALTAKAHSPPPAVADTITIQFNTGGCSSVLSLFYDAATKLFIMIFHRNESRIPLRK